METKTEATTSLVHIYRASVILVKWDIRIQRVLKDGTHPSHSLFSQLPSDKRYRSICCCTTRIRSSFFPQSVRLIKSSSTPFYDLSLNHPLLVYIPKYLNGKTIIILWFNPGCEMIIKLNRRPKTQDQMSSYSQKMFCQWWRAIVKKEAMLKAQITDITNTINL